MKNAYNIYLESVKTHTNGILYNALPTIGWFFKDFHSVLDGYLDLTINDDYKNCKILSIQHESVVKSIMSMPLGTDLVYARTNVANRIWASDMLMLTSTPWQQIKPSKVTDLVRRSFKNPNLVKYATALFQSPPNTNLLSSEPDFVAGRELQSSGLNPRARVFIPSNR